MAISKLSKEFKKIRIDREINRAQMAKDLKISDKTLEAIELGRLEVTPVTLRIIGDTYTGTALESDALFKVLMAARADSVQLVKFDMTKLSDTQKARVILIRDAIAEENAAADALAAVTAKKARDERAAARVAAKSKASAAQQPDEPVPEPLEEKAALEPVEDEDLSFLDDLVNKAA